MEQIEDETEARAQQRQGITQTSSQSHRYDQIQMNLQQPHGFSNAQVNAEGGLQSPKRYDLHQTEQEHDGRGTWKRSYTQQQMPDRDQHQPGCSATITHRNPQTTIRNSSEDRESIPGQNRVNKYPASSRDNPLTSRRDDSSDDDHKPEPSHRIRLEERNVKLSPE